MKIAIVVKQQLDKNEVIEILKEFIEFELVEDDPEYVFSFGGDGTFLDALELYGNIPIYIPINFGTLGFYTSWNRDNMKNIQKDIIANKMISSPRLEINLYKNDGSICSYTCNNDVTVLNPLQTLMLDIYINNYQIEHFRGTGVCVSTPCGSTAYNKSLGGSLISPSKKLYQLSHIAPINNVKFRNIGNSLVFDQSETLTFIPIENQFDNCLLTIDRITKPLIGVTKVEISLAKSEVKILVNEDYNFYERVKKAFIE